MWIIRKKETRTLSIYGSPKCKVVKNWGKKTVLLNVQCRSKGNISGGGGGTRAPEARGARGEWGDAPPENFEI